MVKKEMKNLKVFAGVFLLAIVLSLFVIPMVSAWPTATVITTNVTNGTWYKAGTNLSVNFTFVFTTTNDTEHIHSLNFTGINYTFWNSTTNTTGLHCGNATGNSTAGALGNLHGGNILYCTNSNTTNANLHFNITLNLTLNTTNNGNDYSNGTARTITINWTTNATPTTVNTTTWNFSLDGTVPKVQLVNYSNGTITHSENGSIRKNTQSLNLSVLLTDTGSGNGTAYCIVDINGTNQTYALSGAHCNITNGYLGSLADGNRTIKIYVNDSVGNLNMTNGSIHNYTVMVDTTTPTATPTCSPKTVATGEAFPCSCAGSDVTSGVSNTSGSSTSSQGTGTPTQTGTFTYTCTVWDIAVNTADASTTYTIEVTGAGAAAGGGGTGGGGTGAVTQSKTSYVAATSAAPAIVKNFNEDIGVKEIQIEVNNDAQSIQVDVKKYDGKPADVSVERTGKVYQYLQIEVKNVADKLSKATVQFKVEKSWATDNSVNKENVVVSKFNEDSSEWMEQSTTYSSEDDKFYYYNVELTSFSYFAISSKATTEAGEAGTTTTGTGSGVEAVTGMMSWWIWLILGIAVVVVIFFAMGKRK